MVLTKYFSLFGLSISLSKNIFILKCGYLSSSNNLKFGNCNFSKKSGAYKNLSVINIVALYDRKSMETETTT